MFKKLDWYIIKKFLGTFFFTLLLFMAVSIVIDFSENVDDFVEKEVPVDKVISGYYLNFIPQISFMLFPIFIFIAVIFFTSRLANRSEIVAAYGTGVSFYRILFVPYMLCAFMLTGFQLYANHYWVPQANERLLNFENTYISKSNYHRSRNIHFQVSKDEYAYLENYSIKDSTGYKFAFEKMHDDKLVYKIRADKIKWKTDHWEIVNYYKRYINGLDEKIEEGEKMDTTLALLPEDFGKTEQNKDMMITPDLKQYIAKERSRGVSGLALFDVEVQRRSAVPFATILLTIMGYAIASRKMRGGMGLHLAFGAGLSSAMVMLQQFSHTFSIKGGLDPVIGSWMPNIIFTIICIILLKVAQK